MTVTCPSCQWTKDIPDEKIPAGGASGTCPKCQTKFSVSPPTSSTNQKPITPQPDENHIYCPKCGTAQPASDVCSSCGIVLAKFIGRKLDEKEKEPAPKVEQSTKTNNENISQYEPAVKSTKILSKSDYFGLVMVGVIPLLIFASSSDAKAGMCIPVAYLVCFVMRKMKKGRLVRYATAILIAGIVFGIFNSSDKAAKVAKEIELEKKKADLIRQVVYPTPEEKKQFEEKIKREEIKDRLEDARLKKVLGIDKSDSDRKEFYAPNQKNCSSTCGNMFSPGSKDYDACVYSCTH